jgi:hypothetical protein
MDFVKYIANELNYLNAPGYPKVTGIRNLQTVPSENHFQGYSFTFEACVNGEWESYGPDVNGNWTCRSDRPGRLPDHDPLWKEKNTDTIFIGWYQLDEWHNIKAHNDLEDKIKKWK